MNDAPPATAKLCMHGRCQAVQLPEAFRFAGTEVFLRRQGAEIVLSARPRASIQSLIDALSEIEAGPPIKRQQGLKITKRKAIAPG